jgi:predicted TIM-barrel enzyme
VTRADVLARLRAEVSAGRPLVIAGVGTGVTARAALDGGADLVVAYHSAPFRLAGVPSIAGLLPLANANAVVREIAGPILRAAAGAPVLATACAADPATAPSDLAGELRERGFAGVMTAPTATLIDGSLRAELERAGFGFGAELRLITAARALDLVSCAYATTPDEAVAAADAGADLVIAHLGVTGGGTGRPAAGERLRAVATALADREALLLCHGGPLDSPGAVRAALDECPGLVGSFGASTLERTPIERAVRAAAAAYKLESNSA